MKPGKDIDGILIGVNLHQTAPVMEQSDLGLHYLLRHICLNILVSSSPCYEKNTSENVVCLSCLLHVDPYIKD